MTVAESFVAVPMRNQAVEQRVLALRQARLSLGLTVEEVAKRAGLERSTLSTYEGGAVKPTEEALSKWRAAVEALARVRNASVQVALDDLGAM